MSDKVAEISDPTHHTSLMTSLRQFVNTESFVDIQFICQGGHKVFAHKLMLISVSRLLKKLLTENPDSNEMITIHLPDVNSKLLRIVVNFLYIGFMRLNNTEMEQFKLVLGLLDIELCQKTSEGGMSTVEHYGNNYTQNPNVGQTLVKQLCPAPSTSSVYHQQPLLTGFTSVAEEASRVTNMPVENRMQQYITIQANQLASSGNPGEVLIPLSAVPMISGGNSMVVSGSVQNLTSGHQPVISGENQYNPFTNNVVNSSVMASTTNNGIMQQPLVSSNIQKLTPQQLPIQQNILVQQKTPQQQTSQHMVQYVVNQDVKTVLNSNSNSNVSFTNTNPESSCSITSPLKTERKRRSSHFKDASSSINKVEAVIDLSDDDETNCKLKIQSIHCLQKNGKRKSKNKASTSSINSFGSSVSNSNNHNNNNSISMSSKEVIELDQ